MPTLFPIPSNLVGAASDAATLFTSGKVQEAIALCDQQLTALEKQIPPRNSKPPQTADPASPLYQYYALTLILVNSLAQIQEWKSAKAALGKYRVHFPRDPWGFSAGAQVTRRDPVFKDKAAIERAAQLLDDEAKRLQGQ
ncbi:MAG TPA: hypothetical protein VFD70_23305 [Anaerolineae bacterium]|nr:hypothetical protein [Anaerolineae bacterium]